MQGRSVEAYAVPEERGILEVVDSGSDITTDSIIQRIIENRLRFRARNDAKEAKER